jgi:HAD superfamily hydrolase (TIGR01509 family)
MSQNFQAVFFDMDGLFLDSEPAWHEGETDLMLSLGYSWSEDDQLECLGGPLSRISAYMSKCVAGSKTPQWFEETIVNKMALKLKSGAPLMPGAKALSDSLKVAGIRHALVSASPRVIVDSILESMPEHNFEFSVAAGDIPRTKPFPDPYLHAARILGVDITKCVIFEDSVTGITAAKASGAYVVAVPNFIDVQEEPRLKVVKSLEDVSVSTLAIYYELDRSL